MPRSTGGRGRWRTGIAVAAVLLITSCSGPSAQQAKPNVPSKTKAVFIVRLIGFCAGVNQRLKKEGPDPAPAQVAQELEGLIRQAISEGVPEQDRGKFDAFLTSLAATAGKFREVQDAESTGDAAAQASALAAAKQEQAVADSAAVNYGMPHLKDCDSKDPKRRSAGLPAGSWQPGAKAPLAVQQAATAVLDGNIWVVGGLVDGEANAKIKIYDPVLSTWAPGPDLPIPLHHAMTVFYHGELVVMGGFAATGSNMLGATLNGVYRLAGGRTWVPMTPLAHARAAGAAAVVGDRIVVTGGRDTTQLVPSTEIFDGQRWQAAAPIPIPGDHLGVASDAANVYVVGGRKISADKGTGALQRFDVQAGQWTQLPAMPTPRGGLGAALIDDRIIAVGGETPTSTDAAVEAYDVATQTWSALSGLTTARHGLAVAAVNHRVYAIAGATRPGHLNGTDGVEVLDLSAAPTPSASPVTAPVTTAAATAATAATAASTIFTCPGSRSSKWVCLTSARVKNGALVLKYTTNFSPSARQDPSHFHLHLYTANPDGRGGTSPSASVMMHVANMGSWFNIYDESVQRIDGRTVSSGVAKPLDTKHFSLLCARVASGLHSLVKDEDGGLASGDCAQITR